MTGTQISTMPKSQNIWAVIPVKETHSAKQRLANVLPADTRRLLALAMLEDVLQALAAAEGLAGIAVVTLDPDAGTVARRWGAQVWSEGAREGHTGAVATAAARLAAQGAAMLTLPGDVPLVQPEDIAEIFAAHLATPGFVIVPARDELGSNAILSSPANRVPLQFGANSYFPHLAAARSHGVEPAIVRLPRIAHDVDEPADLFELMKIPSTTRARTLLSSLDLLERAPGTAESHAVA